ncbi:MAG: oxidoreductase [Ignavibacteria bacterium]|nr:oxidoreductase [Ignavibacteria bacterium]
MKKVVLITGASSGIGKATAEKLLNNGYAVYATARRLEMMEDLRKKGAKTLAMDVTSDEAVTATVDRIIKETGRLDVLVNNAGYGIAGMVESVSMEEAHKQFEVNVFGVARLMKAVFPQMRKQKSGRIINVSSIAGKVSSPMLGWYSSSKFAVEALTDAMRAEVKDLGIQLVLIQPNGVKTNFADVALKQLDNVKHPDDYKTKIEGFKKAFPKQFTNAPQPDKIADIIIKAIENSNPKARYAVASAKMGIVMGSIIPDKLMDNMKLLMLGMK